MFNKQFINFFIIQWFLEQNSCSLYEFQKVIVSRIDLVSIKIEGFKCKNNISSFYKWAILYNGRLEQIFLSVQHKGKMMTGSSLYLYEKFFQERQFERLDLFQTISDEFKVQRALYPGSFVHVTPSFVFPDVVYVDNDKQARQFFAKPEIYTFIAVRKNYPQETKIAFHFADYRDGFDELEEGFDLLISQYAGFIGQYCKKYLKKGGLLLANNSHGDAGMAAIDVDYALQAVFSVRNGKYCISEKSLDEYFVPKSQIKITKEYLERLQKGIGYKKTAGVYLFKKVQ